MRTGLILLAAGKGKRLKKKIPKALVKLKGRPLFLYSLALFYKMKLFQQISLVIPRGYKNIFKKYISQYGFRVDNVVYGGRERVDSVIKGFHSLSPCDYIFIHDCARPFLDKNLVEKILEAVKKYKAVVPGIKVDSTLKESFRSFVRKTLPRENIYQIQTPQAFGYELFQSGLSSYKKKKIKNKIFDDAYLIEMLGRKVKIVPGEVLNFKITYPEDIILARAILEKCR